VSLNAGSITVEDIQNPSTPIGQNLGTDKSND